MPFLFSKSLRCENKFDAISSPLYHESHVAAAAAAAAVTAQAQHTVHNKQHTAEVTQKYSTMHSSNGSITSSENVKHITVVSMTLKKHPVRLYQTRISTPPHQVTPIT